jgi:hypothetical protein
LNYHLKLSVYVPSTQEASQIISKREYSQRIDEVQSFVAKLFGGFSSVSVEGGYVSDEKGLIQEDVTRVVAFASRVDFEDKLDTLLKQIVEWCGKWSQESIGFEFEGDLFYIDEKSKFKNGGIMADGGNLSQNWRRNKFYAVPFDQQGAKGERVPYFYLHGEAEKINGYDICNANSEAIADCLRQGAFLCELIFVDGRTEDAICFSKYGYGRMEGLIVLLSDQKHITNAVEYLEFKSIPSMYDDEEKYLISIGLFDAMKIGLYANGGETDDDDRSYGSYEDYDEAFQKKMQLKYFKKANKQSSIGLEGGRRSRDEYKDLDEDDHTSPIDIPYESFLRSKGKMESGGDILMEDTVQRIDDPNFADISYYKRGGNTK